MPQIRGNFPLPISNAFEGMGRIQLISGGMFYFPSGNYVVTLDANSIVQIYDPVETQWRTYFAGANNGESFASDGSNFRAINSVGTLAGATIAFTAGSGATNGIGSVATGVSLPVSGAQTANVAQVATLYPIVGGTVPAPTVTQGGSGFTVPPLIVIDPPPAGGVQASATCLISGGAIASVTMQNAGAGYTSPPVFWIIPQPTQYTGGLQGGTGPGAIPPPGIVHPNNAVPGNQNTASTGALLTSNALTGSGTLTGVGVINPGAGYITAQPTVAVSGAGAATVTITGVTLTAGVIALIRSQPRVQ